MLERRLTWMISLMRRIASSKVRARDLSSCHLCGMTSIILLKSPGNSRTFKTRMLLLSGWLAVVSMEKNRLVSDSRMCLDFSTNFSSIGAPSVIRVAWSWYFGWSSVWYKRCCYRIMNWAYIVNTIPQEGFIITCYVFIWEHCRWREVKLNSAISQPGPAVTPDTVHRSSSHLFVEWGVSWKVISNERLACDLRRNWDKCITIKTILSQRIVIMKCTENSSLDGVVIISSEISTTKGCWKWKS